MSHAENKVTQPDGDSPALCSGGLVRRIAHALAKQRAEGWKGHAELIGEPQGMSASQWADANWQDFREEASQLLAPNKTGEPRP